MSKLGTTRTNANGVTFSIEPADECGFYVTPLDRCKNPITSMTYWFEYEFQVVTAIWDSNFMEINNACHSNCPERGLSCPHGQKD